MNEIITADWHCHCWRDCAQYVNGVNSRLQDFLDAIGDMFTYAVDHKVERIRVLGDIFHLKEDVPVQAQDLLWGYLDAWHHHFPDVKLEFLAGNHDRKIDREDAVTILPFRSFGDVYTDIEVDKSTKTIIIPWLYDQARVLKFLKELKGEWRLMLFHGELEEAIVGPSDYKLSSTFRRELFDRFQYVFAGHLHTRQKVGKVQYPGNPIAKDWGEPQTDKGFLHVTDKDVKVIHLSYPAFVTWEGQILTEKDVTNLVQVLDQDFLRLRVEERPDPAFITQLQAVTRVVDIKLQKRTASVSTQLSPRDTITGIIPLLNRYFQERNVKPQLRQKYMSYAQQIVEGENL